MKKIIILLLFVVNWALGQNSVTTTNQSIDIQSNTTGTTPLLNVKLTQANPFGQTNPIAVSIETNGQSPALYVKSTSSGAMVGETTFGAAIEGKSNHTGFAGYFRGFSLTNTEPTFQVEQRGLGIGGKFILNNASNTTHAIDAQHSGSGFGLNAVSNSGIGGNFTTNTGEIPLQLTKTTALNSNVANSLLFKTGTLYTGIIKTIGTSSTSARMGFFTFADATPTTLIERMSITDAGNVGIGTTSPQTALHVVGNIRSSNLAGTGNREVYTDANGTLRSNPLCAFSITGLSGGSNFIPNNGTQYEDIIVNLEEYDLGNNFNPSSGTFTAPIKGIYHFEGTFTVLGSTATSGDHTLYLRVTPVSSISENKVIARTPVVTNQSITPRITADLLLNANETVKLIIVNNANVTQTLVGANNSSRFSGRLTMVVN
jgi:hypothetical protein